MSLDELEQLARSLLDRRTGSYEHAPDLARALLALLPVVRAAEAWREQHERRWRETQRRAADPLYVFLPDDVQALADAIDTLREHLGKDGAR